MKTQYVTADELVDTLGVSKGKAYQIIRQLNEELAEQGYIKILPVKAGDKIYVVPSKVNFDLNRINRYHEHNRVYEQTVDEIRFFKNGVYMVYSCYYQQNHHSEFFGETWFLTREEAEKRLKELQNG